MTPCAYEAFVRHAPFRFPRFADSRRVLKKCIHLSFNPFTSSKLNSMHFYDIIEKNRGTGGMRLELGRFQRHITRVQYQRASKFDCQKCGHAENSRQDRLSGAGQQTRRRILYRQRPYPPLHDCAGRIGKDSHTLSAGWFYGETPCALHDVTGLSPRRKSLPFSIAFPTTNTKCCWMKARFSGGHPAELFQENAHPAAGDRQPSSSPPCKDRLKRLYCSTADTSRVIDGGWYDLKINYTQYEISTIIAAARVTVSKLINELCTEGFIRCSTGKRKSTFSNTNRKFRTEEIDFSSGITPLFCFLPNGCSSYIPAFIWNRVTFYTKFRRNTFPFHVEFILFFWYFLGTSCDF